MFMPAGDASVKTTGRFRCADSVCLSYPNSRDTVSVVVTSASRVIAVAVLLECGASPLPPGEGSVNERWERFRAPTSAAVDPLTYFVRQMSTKRFVPSARFA